MLKNSVLKIIYISLRHTHTNVRVYLRVLTKELIRNEYKNQTISVVLIQKYTVEEVEALFIQAFSAAPFRPIIIVNYWKISEYNKIN